MPDPTPLVREEILEPLRRVLRWLASLRDGEGRIVCPEHRIEHTGKSAYVAVMACELLELDTVRDADFLRELAVGQARRLVTNLKREGTSPCHTFRPGFHDPFNCSNNVIDGGACSDALADVVSKLGASLDPADRERFSAASLLHARTYLRYAVLDKGIPAQRAWGLTGLAGALSLERDADLERALLQAVVDLEAIQHADGSYPYHPIAWGAEHPGASDVSAFYQSRVTGFLVHALDRAGLDPAGARFRGPLERGLDFLLALHGPDGIKCGLVEAKPWYFGAGYEVSSHPFDVHALLAGWRRLHLEPCAAAAVRAFRAWVAHLEPVGRPRSHLPGAGRGRSYQCPLFWAAHTAWIARSARDLEAALTRSARDLEVALSTAPAAPEVPRVRWFEQAQLARLEDARAIAWVRGARPGINVHHGSPHGAGLLRVFDKSAGRDLLERAPLAAQAEGEWSGKAGSIALARGWSSGARELRFSAWLTRVHARAGRAGEALLAPGRVISRGVIGFASPRVSSAFDLAPEVELLADGVELRSALAHRTGARAVGSALVRRFRVDGAGLAVLDRFVSAGEARHVQFHVPRAASAVTREASSVAYRLP